jgi:hypothetical protein
MMEIYPWQQSYRDALLELNPAQLQSKIARAISELEIRSWELMFTQAADSLIERQAVADALNGLRAIQRFELSVPFEIGDSRQPTNA